jgi:hypothetical protein
MSITIFLAPQSLEALSSPSGGLSKKRAYSHESVGRLLDDIRAGEAKFSLPSERLSTPVPKHLWFSSRSNAAVGFRRQSRG